MFYDGGQILGGAGLDRQLLFDQGMESLIEITPAEDTAAAAQKVAYKKDADSKAQCLACDPFSTIWLTEDSSEKKKEGYRLNMDFYRGPLAQDVEAALRGADWKGTTLWYMPTAKGSLFEPPYRPPKPDAVYFLMDKLVRKYAAEDAPIAAAHAAKLALVRPSAEAARVTLRISVLGIRPEIWRQVRLPSLYRTESSSSTSLPMRTLRSG